jgi:predicted RNase H-like HicB family nuclease
MNMPRIQLKTEFFEEDGQIIGSAPEINVGSSGRDIADAQRSLKEAIELWIEGCISMGTLEQVLEEDGFRREADGVWLHRQL